MPASARRSLNRIEVYLDQFTNAERATDWRGNNNIAESIFVQMRDEKHPVPEWIVVGAGTATATPTPISATSGSRPKNWIRRRPPLP
jgi:cysteine synthase